MGKDIRFKSKYILLLGLALVAVSLFLYLNLEKSILGRRFHHRRKLTWDNTYEINIKLKPSKQEVPVVIVDEHNEVIPYWYKAVEQGIIRSKGNTLIHIDGHSDMATPEEYEPMQQFKHKSPSRDSEFLPLMQSNDVFIISAIMKGLISHVVWVRPSWNEGSNYTSLMHSYVGTYMRSKTEKVICECQKPVYKRSTTSLYTCAYLIREADGDITIPQDQCTKIRSFTYIMVSEKKFIRLVDLSKVKNLFVDIDEDYFGVESGVQSFIDTGISLETQKVVNEALAELYCPTSTNVEQILNKEIRDMFLQVSKLDHKSTEELALTFKNELYDRTKSYICKTTPEIVQKEVSALFSSLKPREIRALSKAKYCLRNSPRLMLPSSEFFLCHGTIFPNDTLNQIYIGSSDEVKTRGKQLVNMLNFIYNHTQPRFFTIARSLRDGYTPRRQQRYIESVILKSLDEVFEKHGQVKRVVYDPYLVFGSEGWT